MKCHSRDKEEEEERMRGRILEGMLQLCAHVLGTCGMRRECTGCADDPCHTTHS